MGKFKRGVPGVVATLLVLCLGPGTTWAGNSWLDQGKSLLNTVQSGTGKTAGGSGLPVEQVAQGLKEALEKGALAVVGQLGTRDGFLSDTNVHIPLPGKLASVASMLKTAGFGAYADTVEERLNRAAEAAVPKAKQLFLSAISKMTIEDARSILNGADDAATQYFRDKMGPDLIGEMRPVIDKSLETVGAVAAYDKMIGQYKTLPLVPDVKGNLTDYTAGKAMDGIFYYLAQEEKAIRENPAKRTTELLKKVFN